MCITSDGFVLQNCCNKNKAVTKSTNITIAVANEDNVDSRPPNLTAAKHSVWGHLENSENSFVQK